MTGGVVAAVVGPAAPQDASPAGAETPQGPVFALAAAPCILVDDLGPGVFAAGHEGPPVDDVPHPPVRGIAEPDLPSAAGGLGDWGESGLRQQRIRRREPSAVIAYLADQGGGHHWPDAGKGQKDRR